ITNLHPNPTNDFVTCDLYAKSRGNVDIELIDYTGHTVYSRTQFVEYGTTSLTVNMDNLVSGVYLLKVTIEKTGKNVFYKIIKN
ncbi:MAG: T9SS type A sorting domain-containing protein, partial [Bacteroidetes bacterium]|nr:T9SS type A sorting domain-containing protein [Bacteroidota bacterium]